VQDKRREAQRIALQAASKLMGASRVTEHMGGGIRKVLPSGAVAVANNADTQAALIMAAQSAASKIAGSMGVRQSREHALKMQVFFSAPISTFAQQFSRYFRPLITHVTHVKTGCPI
jgi:hypothetical protein